MSRNPDTGARGSSSAGGQADPDRAPRDEQERDQVEQAGDDQQVVVAADEGGVLQAAADDGAEQVDRERRLRVRRRRRSAWRRRRWRGRSAGTRSRSAATSRAERQPEQPARAGPPTPARGTPAMPAKTTGSGGVRNRRVVSTAASTTSSTPAKTSALTNQVVPKSSANVATFLVSSSRKAAPMKNRSAYGRISRSGPPRARTAIRDIEQDAEQRDDVERRERVALEVQERRVVGRRARPAGARGRPGRLALLVGLGHPDRDHGLRPAERVDARRVAEDAGGGARRAGRPASSRGSSCTSRTRRPA